MKLNADFPRFIQAFFTERLMKQQQVSPNTIAAHRDTFRLLVSFAQKRLRKKPSELSLDDLDAPNSSRSFSIILKAIAEMRRGAVTSGYPASAPSFTLSLSMSQAGEDLPNVFSAYQ